MAAVSDYDDVSSTTPSVAVSFASALAASLGDVFASYVSSVASTDPAFQQVVTETLSPEARSNPLKSVQIDPGYWRGTSTSVHVRECKNTATSWPEACVGGDDFDAGYWWVSMSRGKGELLSVSPLLCMVWSFDILMALQL